MEVLEEEERWKDGGPRVRDEGEGGGELEKFEGVKRELGIAAEMLVAAVDAMKDAAVDDEGLAGSVIDIREELVQLVDADPRLGDMFEELVARKAGGV